jgi:hypothetical protein
MAKRSGPRKNRRLELLDHQIIFPVHRCTASTAILAAAFFTVRLARWSI